MSNLPNVWHCQNRIAWEYPTQDPEVSSEAWCLYGICPENKEIIKGDFLTLNVEPLVKSYQRIHVMGNPPFGRQSSLAIKFIKKSQQYCDSISFILPKSFKDSCCFW